jgi:hypothetical protein
MLQRAVDQYVEVALLAPDTLQGFSNDSISGWLRRPDEQRLVVFAPSVEQYDQLAPATPPPGEEPGNGVLVTGGIVLAVIFGLAYLVAVVIRRKSTATGGDVAAA